MKKSILPLFSVLTLIMLLLFPSYSFEGAKNGLLLWFNIVLPTLLPFMLCSSLIIAWGGVKYLTKPLRPFLSCLHLSESGSYTFISGLLCGYPMGAKTAADFVKSEKISLSEGKRLLVMSACPSPMFLAGYVKQCMPAEIPMLPIFIAMYLPVLVIAIISRLYYQRPLPNKVVTKISDESLAVSKITETLLPFDEVLMNALEIMVKIGGYIMIFSILAVYIGHLAPAGLPSKPLILGLVEMTTGIQAISVSMNGIPKAAAILASAAFGGLSGVFQTKTVIKNAGLSIRHYIAWKLFHAASAGMLLILLLNL